LETALVILCITENSSTEGREKAEKGMAEWEVRWEILEREGGEWKERAKGMGMESEGGMELGEGKREMTRQCHRSNQQEVKDA